MADSGFTWVVGGESGEGIDTTGELFALALCRLGYHVYAYRHFPSRIRGGHTHYRLRIATWQVRAPAGEIDCLVAFDQGSVDWNWPQIRQGGMVVHDAEFDCQLPPSRPDLTAYAVPMSEMAGKSGAAIMKNMVAVGVSAAFLGLPAEPFVEGVRRRFKGKGEEVATANAELVRAGHAYASAHHRPAVPFVVAPEPAGDGGRRYLMSGNEALAYGALAAGCRFVAAYPITPATEIMQWLARELRGYGGAVVQCEDELAAINMAVGAAYAGARAMTSTSGPGFSLMTEGMGLAGAAEQPVVIVDDQRGGPSTGLPTKTAQADLQQAVYGGHGEFPRIVITPLTVEDCFDAAVDAFNLAERNQCPVVLAPDLALAMCRQTIDGLDFGRVRIERGLLADPEELALRATGGGGERGTAAGGGAAGHGGRFHRYEPLGSGVSPRAFPGQAGGQHLVTGTEHDASGTVTDAPGNRAVQHAKRLRKLTGAWAVAPAGGDEGRGGAGGSSDGAGSSPLAGDGGRAGGGADGSGSAVAGDPIGPGVRAVDLAGAGDVTGALVLIGFGSTSGALEEARRALVAEGAPVARLSVRIPHPFPRGEVAAALTGARAALIVEGNAEGQLERILRQQGCVPPDWLAPGEAEMTQAAMLRPPTPDVEARGGAVAAGTGRWRSLRRWDGNPVGAEEIVAAARAALAQAPER